MRCAGVVRMRAPDVLGLLDRDGLAVHPLDVVGRGVVHGLFSYQDYRTFDPELGPHFVPGLPHVWILIELGPHFVPGLPHG